MSQIKSTSVFGQSDLSEGYLFEMITLWMDAYIYIIPDFIYFIIRLHIFTCVSIFNYY